MHDENTAKGFQVLGFPCNQFGAQEPGTDAEVLEFATTNYGVSFPMFSKIEVNGAEACGLYAWLKEQTGGADIGWNFEKFLVDRSGAVVARFGPQTTPEEIAAQLPQYLS